MSSRRGAWPARWRRDRTSGGLWLEEDAADKVVVHFRDQIDGRIFQRHGDGGCLVAAKLELMGNALHHGMGGRRGEQPVGEGLAAQTLRAGTDQDDGAAVPDGVFRIVQYLLRLVQIGVLRCAALTDQNDIRFCGDGTAVHPVEIGAARAMGAGHVSGPRRSCSMGAAWRTPSRFSCGSSTVCTPWPYPNSSCMR